MYLQDHLRNLDCMIPRLVVFAKKTEYPAASFAGTEGYCVLQQKKNKLVLKIGREMPPYVFSINIHC